MKRKCETCTHYKCFINKYCSPEWKPLISFHKTSEHYPAGATIFSAGDSIKGIFQIYSGKIKVVTTDGEKEQIIRLAKKEQLLGHRGIGKKMIYPVAAIALEDSEVTFIPIDVFYGAVKANSEFAFQMMLFYADELNAAEKRMKLTAGLKAKEKVIVALMTIIRAFGFSSTDTTLLEYTPTRKDIASIAGTTYETMIRALSSLEKSNIIVQEGKAIRVLDLAYLEKHCLLD